MFDVKEISIRNMLLNALLKWRLIVVGALILAVLFPLVMYKVGSGTEVEAESESEEDVPDPASVQSKVTRISTVSDLYKQIDQVDQQIKQLEPLAADYGEIRNAYIQYFIQYNNESIVPVGSLYGTFVKGNEFIDPLLDIMGSEIDPAVFGEYITFSNDNNNLVIKIPCTKDADPIAILTEAKRLLEDKKNSSQNIEKHSLNITNEGVVKEVNKNLIKDRTDLENRKTNLNSQILSFMNNLTDDEIELGRQMADGKITEEQVGEIIVQRSEEAANKDSDGEKTNEPVIGQTKSIGAGKVMIYAFSGAFLGAFIMFFVCCAMYVLSDRLHSHNEMSKQAGIRLIGTIELPCRDRIFKSLDELIRYHLHENKRKRTLDQQIEESASALLLLIEQKNIKKIILTSSLYGKINDRVSDGIEESIRSKGVEMEFVDDIAYDKSSLLKCAECDGIILIEQLGNSLLSDIEKEINTAVGYGINILGSIVLE